MARNDQTPTLVVCDAGPLIHLDEVGCVDLLADFSEVLVPDAVWREVLRHRPQALDHPALTLRRASPQAAEPAALVALAQVLSLHTGEWEALRVALENRPGLLLTDDTAARLRGWLPGIWASSRMERLEFSCGRSADINVPGSLSLRFFGNCHQGRVFI